MSLTFIKNVEDFTCEQCGSRVTGTGFTNHCPTCLWSKHVDNMPGDRASVCQGMMEPVGFRVDHGEKDIQHRCTVCGHRKWNKASSQDDGDLLIKLSVADLP